MKIRIQDHSVRYRISLKELEALNEIHCIEAKMEIINPESKECEGRFSYAVYSKPYIQESYCEIKNGSINLYLNNPDLDELNDSLKEGVYIQKEFDMPDGGRHRYMVFIEKDRPATKCDKRDEWIYQKNPIHGD